MGEELVAGVVPTFSFVFQVCSISSKAYDRKAFTCCRFPVRYKQYACRDSGPHIDLSEAETGVVTCRSKFMQSVEVAREHNKIYLLIIKVGAQFCLLYESKGFLKFV